MSWKEELTTALNKVKDRTLGHDVIFVEHRGESKFKGVHRSNNKWHACICKDGKKTGLGYFLTQEEAARVYDEAARKLFGDFARTNVDLFGDY